MPTKKLTDEQRKLQDERFERCDLVIGYDVENGDAYVIKDTTARTGRVSYEHAVKRLSLAKLRSHVLFESSQEEGIDETDGDGDSGEGR